MSETLVFAGVMVVYLVSSLLLWQTMKLKQINRCSVEKLKELRGVLAEIDAELKKKEER